ncbi:MAG: (2Fe-2S)-binding protein [Alphaproteobacteria bacterium]|nr:MAG: (2Fe-2S)-binding protein [Alphaproteobacteria bacterium]
MKTCVISFPDTPHAPATLPEGANLSETLTVMNSPMLFGCRAGICGTCLIQVEDGYERLVPPTAEEQEALEVYAPGNPKARLGCQMRLTVDVAIKKIRSA